MSHVPHVNESCHTCEWLMSHIWLSHFTHEWHVWISHVTHMNESRHTHKWVMSHTWASHVSHMSCHTYEWVMSHILSGANIICECLAQICLIHWCAARLKKTVVFVTLQPRNFDMSSASERAFLGVLAIYLLFTPSKKRCFSTHQLTRSWPTVVVTAPHRALWCICENKVICARGHRGVDTTHIHTSEGDSVLFLFDLHRHGHADGPLGVCQ